MKLKGKFNRTVIRSALLIGQVLGSLEESGTQDEGRRECKCSNIEWSPTIQEYECIHQGEHWGGRS